MRKPGKLSPVDSGCSCHSLQFGLRDLDLDLGSAFRIGMSGSGDERSGVRLRMCRRQQIRVNSASLTPIHHSILTVIPGQSRDCLSKSILGQLGQRHVMHGSTREGTLKLRTVTHVTHGHLRLLAVAHRLFLHPRNHCRTKTLKK